MITLRNIFDYIEELPATFTGTDETWYVPINWRVRQELAHITYREMDSARRLYKRERRLLQSLTGRLDLTETENDV